MKGINKKKSALSKYDRGEFAGVFASGNLASWEVAILAYSLLYEGSQIKFLTLAS